MKTTVTGYPRIGKNRELKFAVEKYWKGKITGQDLKLTAAQLVQQNISVQKQAGLDSVPCNDFSYYDGMLDLCFMLNAIPQRYAKLGLSELDTYFSMARGYQGQKGDVKALAMKKWFTTNYHYIVPELDDETDLSLNDEKFLASFRAAAAAGVPARPVTIGPYTFLKLAHRKGTKTAAAYESAIIRAFCRLLADCEAAGVEWVQIDEPSLVTDMTAADTTLFSELYRQILSKKGAVKVLLQTYFGDIRDCYADCIALDFDGLGLDFVEGKKNAGLLEKNGFPENKTLFAGVVNGRNIWKSNYGSVLDLLVMLKKRAKNIVVTSSCSLQYVPYTVASETELSADIKKHFAFAREKLVELREIAELADTENFRDEKKYRENAVLTALRHGTENPGLAQKIKNIGPRDYTRKMARSDRQKLQRKLLSLGLLPTTTIGSFPQTPEVKQTRKLFRTGKLTAEQYDTAVFSFIRTCIREQEETGLDVLVHGEYERNDMVEYFGEHLNGFVFTGNGWVQSYGTRCVKPPIIFGDISRPAPITVKYSTYAQQLTDKPVKGMLTGPVTILNWSFPREDLPLQETAYQIALAMRDEVLDLEKAGIKIIQIDEAALREKLPLRKSEWHSHYLDWAIKAFRLCTGSVKPETQIHTHMCYSEFGDIMEDIDAMDADVITFEASRSDLAILEDLKKIDFETEIGPGIYDIHSPRIPPVAEMTTALEKMVAICGTGKLWVNPDCGLKTRGTAEVDGSLRNMVKAAERVRDQIKKQAGYYEN
jgi:5-methyltetrahydropteroyltriglutamate--homocysteine methyltransferase